MALAPFSMFEVFDDPVFRRLNTLARFDSDVPTSNYIKDTHAIANTLVDVKETEKGYNFIADLPGLKREEVKVQLEDGNVLVISGERAREEKKETEKYHRVERSYGKFLRRFQLPKDSDVGKISAASENGVLTISVPKVPPPEPKKPTIVDVEFK
jgi:HSP20 family protein